MPQVFKVGSYIVYFWMNESSPLEPIHIHIAEGTPSPGATKVWITKSGKCLLSHNASKIPAKQLNAIMKIVEARSSEVKKLWFATFGQISYYC